MGLLNSALQIGRSALLGYEGALHVIGSNIAGAGSPDYTRLSPRLDPLQASPITGELQPGAGVALTAIQRNIDEALEGRVRLAIGAEASAATQMESMARIEPMFDELGEGGIGFRLTQFFRAFSELQTTPEDPAMRDFVVNEGARLAGSLRDVRSRLMAVSEDINSQIAATVGFANQLAAEIAVLNTSISTAEASARAPASGLRDQRDARLRELGGYFDVTVREQLNGTINVYVGSETLIQGNSVRELVAVNELDNGVMKTSIRFSGTNQQVMIRGGRLEGLLVSRDQNQKIDALDELASRLIAAVNEIHADGQGLVGYRQLTAAAAVSATDMALDSADIGLSRVPHNGSFYVTVADDASGTPVAYRIDVNLDGTSSGTTLDSLVSDFNSNVLGVTASVNSENQLEFAADSGFSFTFGHDGQEARPDRSGILAALGINTFFTGADARTIAVNDTLVEQPLSIASASVFLPGDGATAGLIAALDVTAIDGLGGVSLLAHYGAIANSVAMGGASARDNQLATSSVLQSLQAQRESISGVNLDEEAISLLKYERAFQGTARFIRVVDDLISELVTLIR